MSCVDFSKLFFSSVLCVSCRLCPSPCSISDHAADLEKNDFFMLEPSEESNGCFLAVLRRVVSTKWAELTPMNGPRQCICFPPVVTVIYFGLCPFYLRESGVNSHLWYFISRCSGQRKTFLLDVAAGGLPEMKKIDRYVWTVSTVHHFLNPENPECNLPSVKNSPQSPLSFFFFFLNLEWNWKTSWAPGWAVNVKMSITGCDRYLVTPLLPKNYKEEGRLEEDLRRVLGQSSLVTQIERSKSVRCWLRRWSVRAERSC